VAPAPAVFLSLFRRYREVIPDYDDFCAALERPLPNQARINTLRVSPEAFIERMDRRYGAGIRIAPGPFSAGDVIIDGLSNPGGTIEYFLGHYHMQGFSSMIPPLLLDPRPGHRILDICAAPGSKTTQVAAQTGNRALIVANDIRRDRLNLLKFQLERLGVLSAVVTNYQAQAFPMHAPLPEPAGNTDPAAPDRERLLFDRILADVPCTGEGTFRLHTPERKNRRRQDPGRWEDSRAIAYHAKHQWGILRHAWDLLAPGGILVYSTCTFAPEENEAIVDRLLRETPACVEESPLPGPWEPGLDSWNGQTFHPDLRKALRVYPHRFDSWGFFAVRLRKPR